ncbi:hypothetical protein IFR05_010778 [Cadophora sp. M221]|nr:hypothetical protein IFR05_010778 [Cadophora sp. M221]
MHISSTITALTLALSTIAAGQSTHYSCSRQLSALCCTSAGVGCGPITGTTADFTCVAPQSAFCCLVSGGVLYTLRFTRTFLPYAFTGSANNPAKKRADGNPEIDPCLYTGSYLRCHDYDFQNCYSAAFDYFGEGLGFQNSHED